MTLQRKALIAVIFLGISLIFLPNQTPASADFHVPLSSNDTKPQFAQPRDRSKAGRSVVKWM